jgi:hypothetical protein
MRLDAVVTHVIFYLFCRAGWTTTHSRYISTILNGRGVVVIILLIVFLHAHFCA